MSDRRTRIDGAGGVAARCDRQRLLRRLGLSTDDIVTPLTIIGAAHVRLRRVRQLCRRSAIRPRRTSDLIRQISEARDVLLRQGFAPRPQLGPPGED